MDVDDTGYRSGTFLAPKPVPFLFIYNSHDTKILLLIHCLSPLAPNIRLSLLSYLNTYHLFMSKEDHVLLVKMYLAMIHRSPTDYKNVDHCSKVVRRLLKKV